MWMPGQCRVPSGQTTVLFSSCSALSVLSLALRWASSCPSRLMRWVSAGQHCPISDGSSERACHSRAYTKLPSGNSSSLNVNPGFHAHRLHSRLMRADWRSTDNAAHASSAGPPINAWTARLQRKQPHGCCSALETSAEPASPCVWPHLTRQQASCAAGTLPPHARCQTPACASLHRHQAVRWGRAEMDDDGDLGSNSIWPGPAARATASSNLHICAGKL